MSSSEPLSGVRHLCNLGKPDEAEKACLRFLEDHPTSAEAWRLLGELNRGQGKMAEAEVGYRRALAACPDDPEALNGLGITLAELGRVGEARDAFRHAVGACPEYAQAHHNLGVALAQSGQLADAVECFRVALRRQPEYAQAYLGLANALAAQEKNAQAVDAYRAALRIRADSAPALNGLGLALIALHRPAEAAVMVRQATRLTPKDAGAFNNLGLALGGAGRYGEAESAYKHAVELDPEYGEAHSNLGNAYKEQGRLGEALACYDMATWLCPGNRSARWNRSLTLLQMGEFEEGWDEYETRWGRTSAPAPRTFTQPQWDGSPLDGRTVLVHAEQGLGDTLQFVRYAGLLKQRGATVVMESPAPLAGVLSTCPAIDRVVTEGQDLPIFDVHTPLMSLPRLFSTRVDSVPADVPYLFPPRERVERWRGRLAGFGGLNIGIAWQGNPHHPWDRHRSVKLATFEAVAKLEGIRLFSLQRGPGTEQLGQIGGRFSVLQVLEDSAPDAGAVMDTAALMINLDLVVTVDTATAHLAGAVGARVWVLLSTVVDWRWMLHRLDSPWYPTMRLFRQERRDDWGPVFGSLAKRVTALRDASRGSRLHSDRRAE